MNTFQSPRNTLLIPGLVAALVAALALAGNAAVAGNDNESTPAGPQQLAQSQQFSDEDVKAFVEARDSVIEISQEWEERIQNAESQEEVNSLQQASQEEMVEAVRAEGLSVNDYNMMVDAARGNPELQERINEFVTQ